jgi:glutathione S-transferase
MITVHHLNNSRSQRVLWLLEELELPYEIKFYQRDPKTMRAPPDLKSVHPLGKSPVITDGEKTIAESGTIVNYLINNYAQGRLLAKDRLRYNYWMHYAEGSAMPLLVMQLVFDSIPRQVPGIIRPIAKLISGGVQKGFIGPQLETHVAFWDAELQKSAYFAGDELSGADIMMSFPLEAASAGGGLTPRLTAYLAELHARPAYQKALERGGAYALPGH